MGCSSQTPLSSLTIKHRRWLGNGQSGPCECNQSCSQKCQSFFSFCPVCSLHAACVRGWCLCVRCLGMEGERERESGGMRLGDGRSEGWPFQCVPFVGRERPAASLYFWAWLRRAQALSLMATCNFVFYVIIGLYFPPQEVSRVARAAPCRNRLVFPLPSSKCGWRYRMKEV